MIDVLFCCTKAKPYLYERRPKQVVDISSPIDGEYAVIPELMPRKPMNGTVVLYAKISQAFDLTSRPFGQDDEVAKVDCFSTCLTYRQLSAYQGGSGRPLWGLRLDDVLVFEEGKTFALSHFFLDKACTRKVSCCPQSYCRVYEKARDAMGKLCFVKEFWLFSVQSDFAVSIMDGHKRIEVRHGVPLGVEKLYRYVR